MTVTNASGVFAGFDMLYGVNTEPASCVRPSASASCWLTVSWFSDGTPKNSAVDVARYVPTASRTPNSMMRSSDDLPTSPRGLPDQSGERDATEHRERDVRPQQRDAPHPAGDEHHAACRSGR